MKLINTRKQMLLEWLKVIPSSLEELGSRSKKLVIDKQDIDYDVNTYQKEPRIIQAT